VSATNKTCLSATDSSGVSAIVWSCIVIYIGAHLDRHLWSIVRVTHLSGHVEAEVWVVWNQVLSNLDHLSSTLLESLR
jgi:hypothetical protein